MASNATFLCNQDVHDHCVQCLKNNLNNTVVVGSFLSKFRAAIETINPSIIQISPDSHLYKRLHTALSRVSQKVRTLRHKKKERELESYLKSEFDFSIFTEEEDTVSDQTSPPPREITVTTRLQGKLNVLKLEKEELSKELETLRKQYNEAMCELQEINRTYEEDFVNSEDFDFEDLKSKYKKLQSNFQEKCVEMDTVQGQLTDTKRNLNKKLKRREETIAKQSDELTELKRSKKDDEMIKQELSDTVEKLQAEQVLYRGIEEKLQESRATKRALQKKVTKLRAQLGQTSESLSSEIDLNLDEIQQLQLRVKQLKTENKTLEEVNALLEEEEIKTFEDGRYTDDIRQVVMELLSLNVSMSKINSVIRVVLAKLAMIRVDEKDLPSNSLKSRLMLEARHLGYVQVGEAMLRTFDSSMSDDTPAGMPGNTLHTDGTSKKHRQFQNFQITIEANETLSVGLREMGRTDAESIMQSFTDCMAELSNVVDNGTDAEEHTRRLITSVKNTMTDLGSTNLCFNRKLQALREEVLPKVIDNWDSLEEGIQSQMSDMGNFFCKLHLLVNFASECDKSLSAFDSIALDKAGNQSFSSNAESGSARLVRTAVKAFHPLGSEEAGVASHFQSLLDTRDRKLQLISYRGNRFNVLFYDAAATYYHIDDMKAFTASWPNPNALLRAVQEDLSNKVYIAGIRALGMIDKIITGPFWRMLESRNNILEANQYLAMMQAKLESWAHDASDLMAGERMFIVDEQDILSVHKDALYHSLFADTDDDELDILTQQALELLMHAILLILERQAKDQLPGGKYADLTEIQKKRSSNVPTTNSVSERDFASLDMLMRNKPAASVPLYETLILWTNNKTSTWLDSKRSAEKGKLMKAARDSVSAARDRFLTRRESIKAQKQEVLLQKQKAKADAEKKSLERKVLLTNTVSEVGGVWTSTDQVDANLSDLRRQSKPIRTVLVSQIHFYRYVLESKARKHLFYQSQTVNGKRVVFTDDQLIRNLKELIQLSSVANSVQPVNQQAVLLCPEARRDNFLEQKAKAKERIQKSRHSRIIQCQKEKLPGLLKNPEALLGSRISFNCSEEGEDTSQWFDAVVLSIANLDRVNPIKTEYFIRYDLEEEDEIWKFPLLQDLKRGDLLIV